MREYAAAGAKLLDTHRPGWYNEIEVGNLDLASGSFCVLGQLAGSYDTAFDEGIVPEVTRYAASKFGFMTINIDEYPELTFAWLQEIMMRRNPPVVEILKQTLAEEAKELVPA